MSIVYRLLNTGTEVEASERRRAWLEVGVPVIVARDTIVTLRFNVEDGIYEPFIDVHGPDVHLEVPVPFSTEIDLGDVAGIIAIPRAVAVRGAGGDPRGFHAVLLEFIRLNHITRWAV